MTTLRFTTADLEALPDPLDDTRYEIIDGELYVSKQPSLAHQFSSDSACAALRSWSDRTGRGMAFSAPGVIFAEDDNVAPDVVWLSTERLRTAVGGDGKLHEAPELMVEVLSPGTHNQQRDRDVKLKLYSRRGVREYWIIDCELHAVAVYRRNGDELQRVATLADEDALDSPLLPGFRLSVRQLFLPNAF